MLIGRTRLENFSSPSFLYIVCGLARLNISPASALHTTGFSIVLGLIYSYIPARITDVYIALHYNY
jgi:hypothetical protein